MKKNLIVFLIINLYVQISFAKDIVVDALKNKKEISEIKEATKELNEKVYVDTSKIVKVKTVNDKFYIVPIIKFGGGVRSGCYIQKLNSHYELEEFIPVGVIEGKACYGIISIYSCNHKDDTGIGIISDMKFGANNFHPQGAFLDIDVVSQVSLNPELSSKIQVAPTASEAKKMLGCDK